MPTASFLVPSSTSQRLHPRNAHRLTHAASRLYKDRRCVARGEDSHRAVARGSPFAHFEYSGTPGGAYFIYDKNGSIICVGKGRELRRRIQADHCGGDVGMSTSTFRRSVSKAHAIAAGQPVREWVRTDCSFAFVEIPDPDLCSAVEAATLRL